jgi:hypothetical protein
MPTGKIKREHENGKRKERWKKTFIGYALSNLMP